MYSWVLFHLLGYNFRLEEYGLGMDIASEIHHNPEVVDMMINMTVASANVRFEIRKCD